MIEQLLPAGVVAVEAFDDVLGEPVFPGEEDLGLPKASRSSELSSKMIF
jgi:hypothetical protein